MPNDPYEGIYQRIVANDLSALHELMDRESHRIAIVLWRRIAGYGTKADLMHLFRTVGLRIQYGVWRYDPSQPGASFGAWVYAQVDAIAREWLEARGAGDSDSSL